MGQSPNLQGWLGGDNFQTKGYYTIVKPQEENKEVRLWIDEYVSILDKNIERARVEEEREDF